ncbi:MAG: caspase family protein [Deltaproteobacteria bacterium]|nr:caspase family protein [Deltaproteobacteria bacterium]
MPRPNALLLAPLLLPLAAHAGPNDTAPEGRRVAIVVGVSSYEKLPADLQLDTPRTEAARVAAALEQSAGFNEVRLLTDASATTGNIQAILAEELSKEVLWKDLFLFYFVGHGVGGDFGDPRLLLYDSDPEALDTTSLSVKEFAASLQKWVPASRYVVVTDAAHEQSLNGLVLLGPTGNDWPVIGQQSFMISSAAPRQAAQAGVFSKSFIEGLSGQADANGDGVITGSEVNTFLILAVPNATGGRQLPTVQSKYDPGIEIVDRRKPDGTVAEGPKLPTHRVDKAKFILPTGSGQKVQCRETQPYACDPSCYLFDVLAGPCSVWATVDGKDYEATVDVLTRGLYRCELKDQALGCISPAP